MDGAAPRLAPMGYDQRRPANKPCEPMPAPTSITPDAEAVEAAVFRRLVAHLDANKRVQNIDLMNLAGFCRNCLAKWYAAAAEERGSAVDYEAARERVYGMPYAEWKRRYQKGEPVPLDAGEGAARND